MKEDRFHAILGLMILLWCYHQMQNLQERAQYEQQMRQRAGDGCCTLKRIVRDTQRIPIQSLWREEATTACGA